MKNILSLLVILALCLTAGTVSASDGSSLMEKAEALYKAGDHEAAIPLLREAAEKGVPAAQNKLGNCYTNGWVLNRTAKKD